MSNTALYVITILVWGTTFFAIEFQLGDIAPEVSVVYRYAIAAALLFGWSLLRRLRLRFGFRDHLWFAFLGLMLFSINYIIAYHSQIYVISALTAIAYSMILWMNIVNARIFFGVRAGWRVWIGAALGLVGIATLFAPQVSEVSWSDGVLFGSALALLGAFTASLGNMISQQAQKRSLPVLQTNAWSMFYGSVFTAIIAAAMGLEFAFDPRPGYVLSLLYLSVFGSVAAFGAYLTLVGRIGAHKAGYATVMFPVIAVIVSAAFEGLPLTPPIIAGTLLVLAGNLFVMKRGPVRRQPVAGAGPETDAA